MSPAAVGKAQRVARRLGGLMLLVAGAMAIPADLHLGGHPWHGILLWAWGLECLLWELK